MRTQISRKPSYRIFLCTFLALISAASISVDNVAIAQSPQENNNEIEIEEIIVSARRRNEALQTYAGAADVFNANALRNARVDGLEDIVSRIANAYFEERPGSDMNIFIRGAGTATNGSASRTDAGVGLYYDGIYSYIQGSRIPIVLYDMDRVEVFRGPQGGLYGRNSVGGSVVMHTRSPDRNLDSVEGLLNVEAGNYDSRTLEAAVSLPLMDTVSVRLAAYYDETDSYYSNALLNQREKGDKTTGARMRLLFAPNDDLDILVGLEYLDEDKSPMFLVPNQYGFDYISVSDSGSRTNRETSRYMARVNWRLSDAYELRSVSGYTKTDGINASDLNNLLVHPTFGNFIGIQELGTDAYQFNQDLILVSTTDSPFEWLVGASYFEDSKDGTSDISSGFVARGIADSSSTSTLGIEMLALFADIGYNLSDKAHIGASVRYSEEKRRGSLSNSVVVDSTTGLPIPSDAFIYKDDYSNTSPGITFKYFWSDTVMTYAKVATGYQSGGVNSRASSVETSVFGPSDATNYEIGLRSTLFNNTMTVNATAFHMVQDDYQYQTGIRPFREFVNLGKAETDGYEFELVFDLIEWISIPIRYGYLDAKLKNAPNGRFGEGLPLIGIPKHTYAIGAHMNFPELFGQYRGFLNADYSRTTDRFDIGGSAELDNFERLDVKAGIEISDKYSIHIYGDNLTDDRHLITPSLGDSRMISPPRKYGAGITIRF